MLVSVQWTAELTVDRRCTYVLERHFESDSLSLDTQSPERRVDEPVLTILIARRLLAQLQTFFRQRRAKLLLRLASYRHYSH